MQGSIGDISRLEKGSSGHHLRGTEPNEKIVRAASPSRDLFFIRDALAADSHIQRLHRRYRLSPAGPVTEDQLVSCCIPLGIRNLPADFTL